MTREQAMEEGFVYAGWFGAARVYIGRLDVEDPIVSARGPVSEILMDIQEGFMGLLAYFGVYPEWVFRVTGRLDGAEVEL